VVETRHHQPHRALQHDGKGADHQTGHRFLDDRGVEIAVEQAAAALVHEERVLGMDRAHGDLGHDAGEQAPFEQGKDVEPHRTEPGHHQQQCQQNPRQDPQGRHQRGACDRIDQQLHRDGRGQREQADRHRIDDAQVDIGPVGPDDLPQPGDCLTQADVLTRHGAPLFQSISSAWTRSATIPGTMQTGMARCAGQQHFFTRRQKCRRLCLRNDHVPCLAGHTRPFGWWGRGSAREAGHAGRARGQGAFCPPTDANGMAGFRVFLPRQNWRPACRKSA
jgi:hypothetical protein